VTTGAKTFRAVAVLALVAAVGAATRRRRRLLCALIVSTLALVMLVPSSASAEGAGRVLTAESVLDARYNLVLKPRPSHGDIFAACGEPRLRLFGRHRL